MVAILRLAIAAHSDCGKGQHSVSPLAAMRRLRVAISDITSTFETMDKTPGHWFDKEINMYHLATRLGSMMPASTRSVEIFQNASITALKQRVSGRRHHDRYVNDGNALLHSCGDGGELRGSERRRVVHDYIACIWSGREETHCSDD